jgi:hypothetical protein
MKLIRPSFFLILAASLLAAGSTTQGADPTQCLKTRDLDPRPSTEILPKGTCPIKKGNLCFDREYRTEVSNICAAPIDIHVDAGNKYPTGDYILSAGGKEVFGCLEAVGNCSGLNITVLGFFPATPSSACLREADECDRGNTFGKCCSGLECVVPPGPQQYKGYCLKPIK